MTDTQRNEETTAEHVAEVRRRLGVLERERHEQAELRRLQEETGQPWHRRWNRLLGKPGRGGVGFRYFTGALWIFISVVNGVLRLFPPMGLPERTVDLVFSVLVTLMLPIGVAFVWSAYRLKKTKEQLFAAGGG